MFLDPYFSRDDSGVRVSAEQGSRFAKEVAGDFNPIHDADSRRFCVPGDLLFALVLVRYGLCARMEFGFRGMVDGGELLHFPDEPGAAFDVTDSAGKVCLHVERSGEITTDPARVEGFVRHYVSFSGRNFPHYLQPLLAEHGVMFNPDRPMVIYDSMGFRLERLDADGPEMTLADSSLQVQGRRAEARLAFSIDGPGGEHVGDGGKKLIVSGLRPYDEAVMDAFVAAFSARGPGA